MNIEAYCVKCKTTREIREPRKVGMKNGRYAAKGPCVVCGTTMFKILSKECVEALAHLPVEESPASPASPGNAPAADSAESKPQ